MTARGKGLNGEDRILWEKVARTVRPLGKRPSPAAEGGGIDGDIAIAKAEGAAPVGLPTVKAVKAKAVPARHPAPIHPVDPATRRRIAKGRLPVEGRIDLHGMTQDEAHALLRGFLGEARHRGLRTVIVITGKGSSPASDGVLRRMVPMWLTQPGFADHVSGVSVAARGHGGDGALYLRLKRRKDAHA